MSNKIQPQEYSRGGGTGGVLYIIATPTAILTSATSTGAVTGGTGIGIGLTTIGMTTALRRCSQVSLFLS